MFKLTVVSGPNRGSTFRIRVGENSIGRQPGNSILLQGHQVSKNHCVLIVDDQGVLLKDRGSANGTFINGVLTQEKRVSSGDRISVGDFVLELSQLHQGPVKQAPALPGFTSGFQPVQIQMTSPPLRTESYSAAPPIQPPPPTDLKSKVFLAFEQYVMPVFYGILTKNEWNSVLIGILAVFCFLNVLVSVSPLLDSNTESIIKETARRATFIARQIAESNAPWLAAKAETKTDVSLAAQAGSVRLAVLSEMDGRIIAPASKTGQYLVAGIEAKVSRARIQEYRTGELKKGWAGAVDSSTVMAIWPVEIYNPATAGTAIVAVAVVSIDITSAVLNSGEIGVIYSKSFILSGILFILLGLIIYRVTLRPFQQLSEDLDQVLKGNLGQVTHEYRFSEVNSLWDMLNVLLQRLPKTSTSSGLSDSGGPSLEDYLEPLKALSSGSNMGLVVFNPEHQIVYMNDLFEEMSGIRSSEALGQEIGAVARDQSIGQIFTDLFGRVSPGGSGVTEEVELVSGTFYQLNATAFGKAGESVKCFAITAVKNG